MKKIYEKNDSRHFGNFCVKLSLDDLMFSYIKDRDFLDIYIENKMKPDKAFPLSFLMSYIYSSQNINSCEIQDNQRRIEKLNGFIRKDFEVIRNLINKDNFDDTKKNIDKLLKDEFLVKFPNAIMK